MLKKSEKGGSIAVNVILGVLLLLTAAVLVLLTVGPVYGNTGKQEPVSIPAGKEMAAAKQDQSPVTSCGLEGVSYHITGGEARPQGEAQPEESGAMETNRQNEGIAENGSSASGESGLAAGGGGSTAIGAEGGDYILPDSSTRYYLKEELAGLTDEQLYYARNEIYAKLGRKFKSEELNQYFSQKTWYIPAYEPSVFDNLGDSVFNPYELANRNLIVSIENERAGR